MGEYPDSSELRRLERWKPLGSARELVEYLESISNYDPVRVRVGRDSFSRKKIMKVEYHTMGWSGNEDIIESLRKSKSLFWFFYWQRSDRGGHYYFEIPLWAWERAVQTNEHKSSSKLAPKAKEED